MDLLTEKGQTVNRNGAVQYYASAMLADTKCVVGASSGMGVPYRSADLPGPWTLASGQRKCWTRLVILHGSFSFRVVAVAPRSVYD